jgi:disulfide bond formation protein DsbB
MYPMVLIYLVGILNKDRNCTNYALPLAVIGLGIAVYQVLLQAGFIPTVLFGCKTGVSCAEINYRLFGIFTIPQQAVAGFGSILVLNVLAMRSRN